MVKLGGIKIKCREERIAKGYIGTFDNAFKLIENHFDEDAVRGGYPGITRADIEKRIKTIEITDSFRLPLLRQLLAGRKRKMIQAAIDENLLHMYYKRRKKLVLKNEPQYIEGTLVRETIEAVFNCNKQLSDYFAQGLAGILEDDIDAERVARNYAKEKGREDLVDFSIDDIHNTRTRDFIPKTGDALKLGDAIGGETFVLGAFTGVFPEALKHHLKLVKTFGNLKRGIDYRRILFPENKKLWAHLEKGLYSHFDILLQDIERTREEGYSPTPMKKTYQSGLLRSMENAFKKIEKTMTLKSEQRVVMQELK